MAILDGDVSISVAGDIRWTGGATTYTVLDLHRWLQDKADDASYIGDDILDISDVSPSDRSTDNIITLNTPYNIDDTLAEHLFDGSITQTNGDTVYSGLRVLGAVNNTLTQLMIIQDNALYQFTTTPSTPFWGTQSTGGLNGIATSGILMRCLIKSRDGGADIDGKRIRVQARHWGDSYDFFNVSLGQGESVAAISTTPDAQNATSQATVTAYSHVANIEGFQTIDINNGNGALDYYGKWTYGANTSSDGLKAVWEFTKDLTGNGTAKTIHGINGELFLGVTHSFAYNTLVGGPFTEDEIISWGTGVTAGTGLVLANDGTGTIMYIQLLTGVAPTDTLGITGATSLATANVNGAVSSRTVPKHFIGSYTGTIIGAYGVGVEPADLISADTIQDLLAVTQTPPNNVIFTVSSLVSSDYVLVGPRLAGVLDTSQISLEALAYSGGEATVNMSATIPSDTPASGSFRVFDGSSFVKVTYTGISGVAFTGCVGMPVALASADAFVSYIDLATASTTESFTTVFSSSRDLFVRVRNGGISPIKTFETPATLGTSGGSVAAIRTTDE